jgi:hypothetical protein
VDHNTHGQWWTDNHAQPWSSSELSVAAALGHGGLPRGGENNKEMSGVRFWSSPKMERRRCGGAARGGTAATWSSPVVRYSQGGMEQRKDLGAARCGGALGYFI